MSSVSTPANDTTDNKQDDKPSISASERQQAHYLDMFKAVLHSCLSCAEAGIDEVLDKAFQMADAIYHRVFKASEGSDGSSSAPQTGGAIPDGLERDPTHPNLDPALPQKLPDQPKADAPVDPVAAAKEDKPADNKPVQEDSPKSDKPADEPAKESSDASDKPDTQASQPATTNLPTGGQPAPSPVSPSSGTKDAPAADNTIPAEHKAII